MVKKRVHNIANRFRQERMRRFVEGVVEPLLETQDHVRILDLGGTVKFWKTLSPLYNHPKVSIVTLNREAGAPEGNITQVAGDVCAVPFPDNSFDIVHSNSVIEHVGGPERMDAMAKEVRRLAPHYFLQTPDVVFPIEQHFKLPFVHWLPVPIRARVLKIVRYGRPGLSQRHAKRIRLVGMRWMRERFPDATLWRERVYGLPKSIVAIRQPFTPSSASSATLRFPHGS